MADKEDSVRKDKQAKQDERDAKEDIKDAKVDSEALIKQLVAKVEKLEANANSPRQNLGEVSRISGNTATVGPEGLKGVVQQYPIDKGHYEDPTEKLYDVPELKRFAMRENYQLTWDVDGVTYEAVGGVTYRVPRFKLELYRRPTEGELDEARDKGKPLNADSWIFVSRHLQTEDELSARKVAEQLGISDSFASFEEMMDKMRFQRIKKWLVDGFSPPRQTHGDGSKEMSLGGRMVNVRVPGKVTGAGHDDVLGATVESETIL